MAQVRATITQKVARSIEWTEDSDMIVPASVRPRMTNFTAIASRPPSAKADYQDIVLIWKRYLKHVDILHTNSYGRWDALV